MKSHLRDLLILLAICGITWAVMQIRLHSRQIERNRAELVYTTAVDDETAGNLLDALENRGFINGIPRTFHLAKKEGIFELLVVTQPMVIADPRVKQLLQDEFLSVCESVFAGEQVMVKLANTKLESFHLLVEPQLISNAVENSS